MMNVSTPNIIALAISCALLGLYHLHYVYEVYIAKDPKLSVLMNKKNIIHWVAKHMEVRDASSTVLAVETLRNTIMSAVFIGGYALNASYAILRGINSGIEEVNAALIRDVILGICLFASFLCWTQVIRNACHLGYVIGGWYGQYHAVDRPIEVSRESLKLNYYTDCCTLAEGITMYFSFGFRFLYISIPFSFFALGPIALLTATAVMLSCEVWWDYGRYIHKMEIISGHGIQACWSSTPVPNMSMDDSSTGNEYDIPVNEPNLTVMDIEKGTA